MYVIKRTDQGRGYVARHPMTSSYTHDLAKAKTYRTAAEAKADCCPENEIVVSVTDLLQPGR